MAGGESMRFKAGDRVKIKSLDWYNKNKDEEGDIKEAFFNKDREKFCGTIQVIDGEGFYSKKGLILYCIEDAYEMIGEEAIEGLAEDLTHEEKPSEVPEKVILNGADVMRALKQVDTTKAITEEMIKEAEEYDERTERVRELYKGEQWSHEFECPDGYEFRDENGNVIEAKKIVLEKKKPKWPKSYKECCKILSLEPESKLMSQYRFAELVSFHKLLICRDAYWKIDNYTPQFMGEIYHYIELNCDLKPILNFTNRCVPMFLAFPSDAARDAFYENFRELIEDCKELL